MWTALVITMLAGMGLITVGLRGRRVDDHPLCRKCGFDLIGVYGPTAAKPTSKCPECGTDLRRARSVAIGRRRRRWSRVIAGVVTVLVALSYSGYEVWRWSVGFDWYTVKPLWRLTTEARSQDADIYIRAIGELTWRTYHGKISGHRLDQVLDMAIAAQSDDTTAWRDAWCRYMAVAIEKKLVDDGRMKRVCEQGVRPGISRCNLRVREGGRIQAVAGFQWGYFGFEWPEMSATISDVKIQLAEMTIPLRLDGWPEGSNEFGIEQGGLTCTRPFLGRIDLPPGNYAGQVSFTVALRPPNGPKVVPVHYSQDVQVTVVDQDSQVPESYVDPALESAVSAGLGNPHILAVRWDPARHLGSAVTMMFDPRRMAAPPVDLAFDIFARADGREWWLCRFHQYKGDSSTYQDSTGGSPLRFNNFAARSVDLIFRPAADLAELSYMDRMWGKEVVLSDIEVDWSKTEQ